MEFLKEFIQFLNARRNYWMIPIFLTILIMGTLVVLTKGSAIAPFIYTLF